MMASVAGRYASALYDLANEQNQNFFQMIQTQYLKILTWFNNLA